MSDLLRNALNQRILLLDGATGTMQQQLDLSEDEFRGDRFRDHPETLKGNGDVLSLTCPGAVAEIHEAYLKVGADIIETNTFSANRISQADYLLEEHAFEDESRFCRPSHERSLMITPPTTDHVSLQVCWGRPPDLRAFLQMFLIRVLESYASTTSFKCMQSRREVS